MADDMEEWIKKMLVFTALQLVVLIGVYAAYHAWREIKGEKG